VADTRTIKNKDSLKLLNYDRFDGVIYIFTKAYRNRPDSLKQIPSTKQMERKDGIWLLHGTPYSGPIIDYYYSGRIQGKGTLLEGKVNGARITYYQNGTKSTEREYENGVVNGQELEYYEDGSLRQKGDFLRGKETGIWNSYYPNGQVKLRSNYSNGELVDSAFKYYSNGKVKDRVFIKNGKVIPDPSLVKIEQLMARSNESNKQGDLKSAIKYCSRAIALDSTYASAYFSRGTLKLNNFQFDDAIADFDIALKLEPFMETALSNRAFARIRKYQFGNSRVIAKNSDLTVLGSKGKVPITAEDQDKICADLRSALFLGEKSPMIAEALAENCKIKSNF
jgi:tetratricopeptide (TPR) repeat protein